MYEVPLYKHGWLRECASMYEVWFRECASMYEVPLCMGGSENVPLCMRYLYAWVVQRMCLYVWGTFMHGWFRECASMWEVWFRECASMYEVPLCMECPRNTPQRREQPNTWTQYLDIFCCLMTKLTIEFLCFSSPDSFNWHNTNTRWWSTTAYRRTSEVFVGIHLWYQISIAISRGIVNGSQSGTYSHLWYQISIAISRGIVNGSQSGTYSHLWYQISIAIWRGIVNGSQSGTSSHSALLAGHYSRGNDLGPICLTHSAMWSIVTQPCILWAIIHITRCWKEADSIPLCYVTDEATPLTTHNALRSMRIHPRTWCHIFIFNTFVGT